MSTRDESNYIAEAHTTRYADRDKLELQRLLDDVPMTGGQRTVIAEQLDRLMGSLSYDSEWTRMRRKPLEQLRDAYGGPDWETAIFRAIRASQDEHFAEKAIETITEAIGIDDYCDAAAHAVATWHAMAKISIAAKRAGGGPDDVTRQACDAIQKVSNARRLLAIRDKCLARNASSPEYEAQSAVLDMVKSMAKAVEDTSPDSPLASALQETINVLEELDENIPF